MFCARNAEELGRVALPPAIAARLGDPTGGLPYPPSKLAVFGLDFVAEARWLYTVADTAAPSLTDAVQFVHTLGLLRGSHLVEGGEPHAYLRPEPVTTTYPPAGAPPASLDLDLLALNPVSADPASGGAVIGFVPSQFVMPPTDGAPFRIRSAASDLSITGSGLDTPQTGDDGVAQAGAVTSDHPVSMTVRFKVADVDEHYALYIKHWKIGSAGCAVTIDVNGVETLMRHVDSAQGAGGDDNLTRVVLRDLPARTTSSQSGVNRTLGSPAEPLAVRGPAWSGATPSVARSKVHPHLPSGALRLRTRWAPSRAQRRSLRGDK
jgi:hypothetical protein